ncbi:hypothetical protein [Hyalangium rubrum]|uniref:Lipoprotein n=1 Tax=Hyalangium rubrum TaxID=3103134 RepID=A0ABU5HDY5_9BACT|nr:hypothetical protein [Hyalangium sp. s54d21]MDY7231324.1 hypothetical protein [Hyalangium sp. s54d21]
MRPWQLLWKTEALTLALLVGCIATSPGVRVVLEEFEKALGERVSRRAVMQAAMVTAVTLLAMPEPVTKFIADDRGAHSLGGCPDALQMQAASREGILLSEVSAAESVTVSTEGFSVALAPSAVAMAARGAPNGSRPPERS